MSAKLQAIVKNLVGATLIAHIALFLSFSTSTAWCLFFTAALFFAFLGMGKVILLSTSILLALSLSEIIIRKLEFVDGLHYDPLNALGVEYPGAVGLYRANTTLDSEMPYGNLYAMSVGQGGVVPEPRHIRIQIDAHGFRNSEEYHGQSLILVGDSFLAGNGNTQSALLSEVLRRAGGLDSYSVAYPGDILKYQRAIQFFESNIKGHNSAAKYIIFLFEGNDFPEFRAPTQQPFTVWYPQKLKSWGQLLKLNQLLSIINGRREAKRSSQERPPTSSFTIRGRTISFLNRYMEVAWRSEYAAAPELEEVLQALKDRVARVYFIPTKYRVYHPHLKFEEVASSYAQYMGGKTLTSSELPNRQWEFISKMAGKLGIPITDLTPQLRQAALELLEKREFVFWGDDTHWNAYGISEAAKVILQEFPKPSGVQ